MSKKKVLVGSIFAATIATFGFAAVACNNDSGGTEEPPVEGPETGSYYYDTGLEDYLLTLGGADKFTLYMSGEFVYGTYTVGEDGRFAFDYHTDADFELSATYADDKVNITYNGTEWVFLRKTVYTVTFDSNGGSAVDSVRAINGKTIVSPPTDPTHPQGRAFLGWYKDDVFDTPFVFGSTPVDGNITLYAKWDTAVPGATEYTVTFDYNGSGAASTTLATTGGKLAALPAPTFDGHTFRGWWASQYGVADSLSYQVNADTVFTADTTLYALWEVTPTGSKLSMPIVTVSDVGLSWQAVTNASRYHIEVTATNTEQGKPFAAVDTTVPNAVYPIDFAAAPAGDYTIKVTALANDAANNSATAVIRYKNKALDRVSQFTVVEPNTLVWSPVENAEKYLVTVDCGNKSHKHTEFDNGNSTVYNFKDCPMQVGGIKFIVTAVANGYASSVSAVYTYEKTLGAVTGFAVDEDAEVLSWTAVPNAVGYYVTVEHGAGTASVTLNGVTSISLRDYANKPGGIKISVTPRTTGYNSPAAAVYTWTKTKPATPCDIRVEGDTLRWQAVSGATYEVRIDGGTPKAATNAELDLATAFSGQVGGEYKVSVRAKAGDNYSQWSDEITVAYRQMYDVLGYSASTVSWRHVVGAQWYEVRVNSGAPKRIADGRNSAEVELTRAGSNIIEVRFFDDVYSDWASIDVFAYSVEFDVRGGEAVDSIYKAVGDKLVLPTATRDGFEFGGWYNTPSGAAGNGTKYTDGTFNAAGDMVMYASWESSEFTITFNNNDNTPTGITGTAKYGEAFTWGVPTATDASLGFVGWYSRPYGKGTKYTGADGKSLNNWRIVNGATVFAHFVEVLSFTETADGYSVGKGSAVGLVDSVTIPETYNGKPVVTISSGAFDGCTTIETINIPDTVRTVDAAAFDGCTALSAVNVYEVAGNRIKNYSSSDGSLVYNDEASGDKRLHYVPAARKGAYAIPDGVTALYANTFGANTAVTSVTVPSSVTSVFGGAFSGCTTLTDVVFEGGGTGAIEIQDGAFDNCGALKNITLPKRYTDFKAAIFNKCAAVEYIGVESGGNYAAVDGMLTTSDRSTILFCPKGRSGVFTVPSGVTAIADNAFEDCVNLTEIIVPASVSSIGKDAFAGCVKVTKITFKGSSTARELAIGDGAFRAKRTSSYGNPETALVSVIFENNSKVVDIGEKAFENCVALKEFTFPSTLKTVGDYAFGGCTKLGRVTFAESGATLSLGSYVFNNCTALTSIHLSASVKDFDATIVEGCKITAITVDPNSAYFTSDSGILYDKNKTAIKYVPTAFTGDANGAVVLPSTVTEIGAAAFKGRAIKSVTIGANVVAIGEHAFDGCATLTAVNFDSSNKALDIGAYAFNNCNKITSFAVPSRTTAIGDYAFYYVKVSGAVDLTDVDTIGDYAFRNAGTSSNKMSVTLGADLAHIGNGAFKSAYVENVVFATVPTSGTTLTIGDEAFSSTYSYFTNATHDNTLVLPSNLTTIGMQAFYDIGVRKVVIPNSVNTLGRRAFGGSSSKVETVEFRDGGTGTMVWQSDAEDITSKVGTFSENTTLKYVNIPSRLKAIPAYAFGGCTALVGAADPENAGSYILNIPNTVESIGSGAFRNCLKLQTVNFAEGDKELTFGAGEYYSSGGYTGVFSMSTSTSSLTTVNLPKRLKSIPSYTFSYCKNLANVKIRNTVEYMGEGAFYMCYKLVSTEENNIFEADDNTTKNNTLVIADGTGSYPSAGSSYSPAVYAGAFMVDSGDNASNGFKYLTFPSRLKRIPDYAFYYRKALTTVVIPDTIANTDTQEGIGKYAFSGGYNYGSLNTVEFSGDGTEPIAIGDYAFNYCHVLEHMTLPSRLGDVVDASGAYVKPAIGTNAFSGCSKLSFTADSIIYADSGKTVLKLCPTTVSGAVVIPATVTEIADRAFKGCTSITSITFEADSRLTKIGANAFEGCTGIAAITLPDAVKEIGEYAFGGWTKSTFTSLTIPASVEKIGEYAFKGCTYLGTVTFEGDNSKLKTISAHAFDGCSRLKAVDFGGLTALETIGDYAFNGCGSYTYSNHSFTIPQTVKTIGDYAFNGCSYLTSVVYEGTPSVETIGASAFVGTKLTSVIIPKSVETIGAGAFKNVTTITGVSFGNVGETSALETICDEAFYGCNNSAFTSIEFPASLKSIGNKAFGDWTSGNKTKLTSVTFAVDGELTHIGESAFGYAPLTSVVLPSKLKEIGDYAFAYTQLNSINIPASVVTLGSSAFYNCASLEIVSFGAGSNLTSFGDSAFNGCANITGFEIPEKLVNIDLGLFGGLNGLEEITVAAANPIFAAKDGILFDKNFRNIVFCPIAKSGEVVVPSSVVTVDATAFRRRTQITSIVLSEGLVEIGARAFEGCTGITSISLPDSLADIGAYAFAECSNLEAIAIKDNITSIGEYTFSKCSSLKEVSLPDSLVSIGAQAFNECVELTSVYLPDSVSSIGELTFGRCAKLKTIRLPAGLVTIDAQAFRWCTGLESIELPSTVTTIENSAFDGCTSLKTVNIPASVTSIGIEAFKDCAITSVNIPASVTNISGRSFSGCTQLKTVTFAAGSRLSYLGNGTFNGCTSLESISIPGTVGVVNSLLFNGCTSLENVELGEGITGIADSSTAYLVFGGCTSLKEVKLPSTLTHIGDYAFYQCTALASIDIPDDVTYIGKDAFERCYALTEIVLPDGITAIADNTFQNCTSLTSVTIPDTVISIGNSAFGGCSALMSFTVPQDMETIGTSAFAGCSKLVEVINKSTLEIVKGATTYGGIAQNAVSVHSGDTSLIKQSGDYSFMADGEDWFLIGYTGNENNITLPSAVDGHSYDIFDSAFVGSEVEEVVIPEGVTSIGEKAFYGSKLKKVTLPASLETIGVQAFGNSGTGDSWTPYLKTVVFSDSGHSKLSSIGNSAFRSAPIKSISLPGAAAIDGYAFQNCIDLTSVSLGGATSMGNYAFSGCTALSTANLGNALTVIGDYAFDGCNVLKSTSIPDTVTSIGQYAFRNCYRLAEVNIGDDSQLTTIGQYAFYYCYSLYSITIPRGVTSISSSSYSSYVFNSCYKLIEVKNLSNIAIAKNSYVGGGAGYYAENIYGAEGSSNLVKTADGFVYYDDGANRYLVAYVGNETNIELDAVDAENGKPAYSIYKYAFYYQTQLTSVLIPKEITTIGTSAFAQCSNGLVVFTDAESKPSGWSSVPNTVIYGYDGMEHTYTFDTNGGSAVASITAKYLTALPEAPTKDDLIFVGWYESEDFAGDPVAVPYCKPSDTTLYARFMTEAEYDDYMRDGSSFAKAYKVLQNNEKTTITAKGHSGGYIYFTFTCTETGTYKFGANNSYSTKYCYIRADANGTNNNLAGNSAHNNVSLSYECTVGVTYYVFFNCGTSDNLTFTFEKI